MDARTVISSRSPQTGRSLPHSQWCLPISSNNPGLSRRAPYRLPGCYRPWWEASAAHPYAPEQEAKTVSRRLHFPHSHSPSSPNPFPTKMRFLSNPLPIQKERKNKERNSPSPEFPHYPMYDRNIFPLHIIHHDLSNLCLLAPVP